MSVGTLGPVKNSEANLFGVSTVGGDPQGYTPMAAGTVDPVGKTASGLFGVGKVEEQIHNQAGRKYLEHCDNIVY